MTIKKRKKPIKLWHEKKKAKGGKNLDKGSDKRTDLIMSRS